MKNSDQALIPVVNENDEVIGHKVRSTITQDDIYRVTALWVTNSQGDILLAQRKHTKKHDPGKWAAAVAGTVEENETYDQSIIKETREEIGVDYVNLVKGPHVRVSNTYNFFCQWYTFSIDRPAEDFTIEEEVVEQVRWFSRSDLLEEIQQHPERYIHGLESQLEIFS